MKRPDLRFYRKIRGAALWLPLVVWGFAIVPAAGEEAVPQSMAEVELSFAPVVKKAAPAVVNIYARKVVEARGPSTLFDDPFFKRFFGDLFPDQPRERVQNSLGSGVVVRADGVIVTNSHVIRNADEIVVALADRRELEAKVILNDTRSDLAVLRVETDAPLPHLEFANSDLAEVGDIVLAIGDPFGVGQTVTSGIVSATARTQVGISDYQFFIQTDAAINPGNSGGALVDLNGKLLGINTAIFSRSGGSHGVGFAIPANMVRTVVAGALKEGKVVRPWMGLSSQPVTQDIAASLNLERPKGVMVNGIHPESPARKAGIRNGDVITAVDGADIFDPEGLSFRIATQQVGETTDLTVVRGGKTRTVTVDLIAPPEAPPRNMTSVSGRNPFSGATVGNLNPALAEELGLDPLAEGVIVTETARGSVANRLGLRRGDIIVSVDGREIDRVSALSTVVEKKADREWDVKIRRGGRVIGVTIQL